tara:strand:+ start:53 stop:193 length:141 start_codon:yes stop_codon:yes gene_type:complete
MRLRINITTILLRNQEVSDFAKSPENLIGKCATLEGWVYQKEFQVG